MRALIIAALLSACAVEAPQMRVPYLTPPAGECERQIWDLCVEFGFAGYDVKHAVPGGYVRCRAMDGSTEALQAMEGAAALTCVPWAGYGGEP